MLPNNKVIGIIGGGQLGKMLIEASRPWNIRYGILEKGEDAPAAHLSNFHINGGLKDRERIRELAKHCDVLTFEIEHIDADALWELEQEGKEVIPSARILKVIQDKGLQKQFYEQKGISTLPYQLADDFASAAPMLHQFTGDKVVVKSRRGGYDGKGVLVLTKEEVVERGRQKDDWGKEGGLLIEQYLDSMTEYSVIVARGKDGEQKAFPMVEMYFNHAHLVEFLFSPTRAGADVETACVELAGKAIEAFNGAGLFAVELMVDKNGAAYVNEVAPRPHNSGHHTMNCCYTSQFEQLNRVLLGLPLGDTGLLKPGAMINLTGSAGQEGSYRLKHATELLKEQGVYIHLYNKKEIKPDRKMGHINLVADSLDELLEKANKIKGFASFETLGQSS